MPLHRRIGPGSRPCSILAAVQMLRTLFCRDTLPRVLEAKDFASLSFKAVSQVWVWAYLCEIAGLKDAGCCGDAESHMVLGSR